MLQPHINLNVYNEQLYGVFGNFGSGGNARISYLQTALSTNQLDKITLISDIPKSETWPIRVLFQRDVDLKRVEKGLIPYFQSDSKVKFFNPITLTLLPLSDDNEINESILDIREDDIEVDGAPCKSFEAVGKFRFVIPKDANGNPIYSHTMLEWNSNTVKVVAIDGQHRLSALKRYKKMDNTGDFNDWSIPVVFFTMRRLNEEQEVGSMLDIIRNIFIYINTTAQSPNATRQILLSDEIVNSVCTQEILQFSHTNDVEGNGYNALPLIFYDWRGDEDEGRRVYQPASVVRSTELKSWLEEYILGEDFKSKQKDNLGIGAGDELNNIFLDMKIPVMLVQPLREQFQQNLMLGMIHLLENFIPYKNYIEAYRQFESERNHGDIANHAFHKLRFGSHSGGDALIEDIQEKYKDIEDDLTYLKDEHIPEGIQLDIGMRGIVYAYSELKRFYNKLTSSDAHWKNYSIWFTDALNKVYEDNWFPMDGTKPELFKHLTYDHNDRTILYKHDQVINASGAFLTILISKYATVFCSQDLNMTADALRTEWESLYDQHDVKMNRTLSGGYLKESKVILTPNYDLPRQRTELNKKAEERAKIELDEHYRKLNLFLNNLNV